MSCRLVVQTKIPYPGFSLVEVAEAALKLAKQLDSLVEVCHQQTPVAVHPNMTAEQVVELWAHMSDWKERELNIRMLDNC